eukprot:TRINITY_DN5802_c0_g1_i4.p1 TRINITY_DN5802_c0_g1~~TRINITY_DN5802_c0_g1_i4.p1  ORF type:complete len:296 (-),score=-9.88 TRINITY_DN5802_c0_g1_i4:165-1052(-)
MEPARPSGIDISRVIQEKSTFDHDLVCTICQCVALDPTECSNCQCLFCTACMDRWLKTKNKCPMGCPEPFQRNPPHKKCPNTPCSAIVLRKDLAHHNEICPFLLGTCEKCQGTFPLTVKASHECMKSLVDRLLRLSSEFFTYKETTKLEIEGLQKEVRELKLRAEPNHVAAPEPPRCNLGHVMTWLQNPWRGTECGSCRRHEDARWKCDHCRSIYCIRCRLPPNGRKCPIGHNLERFSGVERFCDVCEGQTRDTFRDAACDFDVCHNCVVQHRVLVLDSPVHLLAIHCYGTIIFY